MAKKKITPEQTAAAPAPAAKRRAPAAKKSQAAPPVDVASVAGTEPLANAADSGASTAVAAGDTTPSHDEIAEAAYFRHLSRAGHAGDEFNDWVEAERELRERRR